MKKLIATVFALIMGLAVLGPIAVNADTIIGDGTTVPFDMDAGLLGGGGGHDPEIICVWELDNFFGDADPTLNGTQNDPPMTYDGVVYTWFFEVVLDEDTANWDIPAENDISQASVDIFHPNAHLEPGFGYFQDEPFLGVPGACQHNGPRLKYDLVLSMLSIADSLANLTHAYNLGDLICYNGAYDYYDVWDLINNGQARVYCEKGPFTYCQPAGYYPCNFKVLDKSQNDDEFMNAFEYVLGVGVETDFHELNFGQSSVGQTNWIYGDWEFDSADEPTVRNIGNWDVQLNASFDDFGKGMSYFGDQYQWNIVYDVRMGDWPGAIPHANFSYAEEQAGWDDMNQPPIEYAHYIHPDMEVTIPCQWYRVGTNGYEPEGIDVLRKCNETKISFAIKIRKDLGAGNFPQGDDECYITVLMPYDFRRSYPVELPCWQCDPTDPVIL